MVSTLFSPRKIQGMEEVLFNLWWKSHYSLLGKYKVFGMVKVMAALATGTPNLPAVT